MNTKRDYIAIHKKYGIICNNSVCGGDCYGTTRCLCQLNEKGMRLYYNKARKDVPIEHLDYECKKCKMEICGCCYDNCPNCKQ